MAEEKLMTFSELCILSGGKVFTFRDSLMGCRQTGLTSIQEDDLCGYASIFPPIHERREIDLMNNLGSEKRKMVRNLR